MTKNNQIQIFNDRKVRTVWDSETEEWYFSVVDVVEVLTDAKDFQTARKYWNKLKERLIKEGDETVTNCHRLKLLAADGKMRMTDVATAEQLFRIIQSIPSPKAEPFKQWMAQVAATRLDQMQDPELSIEQAVSDYRRLGYSDEWINQRLRGIETRKQLTDEWKRGGVKDWQYASLTDIITQQWSLRSICLPKLLPQNYPSKEIPRHTASTPILPEAEEMWQRLPVKNSSRGWDIASYPRLKPQII